MPRRTAADERLEFHLPADLKAAFLAAAESEERPADAVLRDLVRGYLDERTQPTPDDQRLRAEIRAALDESGPGIPHEQVMQETMARLEARIQRPGKRAG